MCFIQTAWHWVEVVVILLSILSWVAVAYAVDAVVLVDYDFYQVWSRLLSNGTFWMGLLILIVIINGKDIYVCGLSRSFDPRAYHVIQEVFDVMYLSFVILLTVWFMLLQATVLPINRSKTAAAPGNDESLDEEDTDSSSIEKNAELKLVELREMTITDGQSNGIFGW